MMKARILLIICLIASCGFYIEPYFFISMDDTFYLGPYGNLYNMRVSYEFSSEALTMPVKIGVYKYNNQDRALVGKFQIEVPNSGLFYINNDHSDYFINFERGEYQLEAVLLSERFGAYREINSLRVTQDFEIR